MCKKSLTVLAIVIIISLPGIALAQQFPKNPPHANPAPLTGPTTQPKDLEKPLPSPIERGPGGGPGQPAQPSPTDNRDRIPKAYPGPGGTPRPLG
jgi:hypothetical protein